MTYGIRPDPEDRGHLRIRCPVCGYRGWSDDCGHCPRCEPEGLTVSESDLIAEEEARQRLYEEEKPR